MSLLPAVAATRDSRPHRDVEIEWWYVFGFLAEHSLMACVWRYPGRYGGHGLMGAYSLTALDGRRRRSATHVDPALLASARDQLRSLRQRSPDPVLDAVLEALEGGGVFAPFRLASASSLASTDDRPIDARVGPLRIAQEDGRLSVAIDEDGLAVALDLDLGGARFPMGGTGAFEIEGRAMSGYTHPQCRLSGSLVVDGARTQVEGRAWFDHQWGQWRLPHATLRHQHPEWRYFAAMLDDGRSLNLYLPDRPDGDGRAPADSRDLHLVLCDRDGTTRLASGAKIEVLGNLESLRTHNRYEYGWRVRVAELDATLEFQPFHPDQEVAVFLFQRGLLEAACRVEGTLSGAPCRGLGFVESFGATVDIHTFFWGQHKTHLAHELERFVPRAHDPAWLSRVCGVLEPLAIEARAVETALLDPIWSMMDRGGKGWRSVWLTTCCHALGHDQFDERVRELLPVVEMLHTGSLVIDDVQDGSPLRRGLPALHHQIGTDLAINVGNLLYFLPLLIVEEARWLTETQRARVYGAILNALRQGHVGQGMDLMTTRGRYDLGAKLADFEGTRRELLEQYRLKSGCQLEAIARIAGVLADADPRRIEAVARYSRTFGVLFQIVDDVIDVHEGREKLGKDHGEDLRNGRLNLLLFLALHAARGPDREFLMGALGEGGETASFERVRDIVRHTGAAERCLAEARAMIDAAWRDMRIIPDSDATIVMRSVPLWLLQQRAAKALEIARAGGGPKASSNGHGLANGARAREPSSTTP